MKFAAALAASSAIFALTAIPAFAGETFTTPSMMLADIGHDITAVAKHAPTDAKIVSAAPAEWPPFEAIAHHAGTTLITIHLDAKGVLANAAVLKSSGSSLLDQSALAAVHASRFAPATVDNTPIAGDYAVTVTFDPETVP